MAVVSAPNSMTSGAPRASRHPKDAPYVKDPERYKTVPCDKWAKNGRCPYGKKCQFAHGEEELRPRKASKQEAAAVNSSLSKSKSQARPKAPPPQAAAMPTSPQQKEESGASSMGPRSYAGAASTANPMAKPCDAAASALAAPAMPPTKPLSVGMADVLQQLVPPPQRAPGPAPKAVSFPQLSPPLSFAPAPPEAAFAELSLEPQAAPEPFTFNHETGKLEISALQRNSSSFDRTAAECVRRQISYALSGPDSPRNWA